MKRSLVAVGLAILTTMPLMAEAQQLNCAKRDVIIARLEAKWGEHFAGGGLQNASSVFEVWMSAEKGTWTILKTSANGMACVMASGTNWLESLPSQKIEGVKG